MTGRFITIEGGEGAEQDGEGPASKRAALGGWLARPPPRTAPTAAEPGERIVLWLTCVCLQNPLSQIQSNPILPKNPSPEMPNA